MLCHFSSDIPLRECFLSLSALIDSEAEGNFIDQGTVNLHLPVQSLKPHLQPKSPSAPLLLSNPLSMSVTEGYNSHPVSGLKSLIPLVTTPKPMDK